MIGRTQRTVLLVPVDAPPEVSQGKATRAAARTYYQLLEADGKPLGVGLFDSGDRAAEFAGRRGLQVVRPKPKAS